MTNKLYVIGVGPGDPQLLTLKALRAMEVSDVIACPSKNGKPGLAYEIAVQAAPQVSKKEKLVLRFPMKKEDLTETHQSASGRLISALESGKTIAFVTLGDPGFYSTVHYILSDVKKADFSIEVIPGITSFSAMAARLQIPLALGEDNILITSGEYRSFDGNLVIMKAGSRLKELKKEIAVSGNMVYMIENCGMEDERVYFGLQEIPDEAGYYSILVVLSVKGETHADREQTCS